MHKKINRDMNAEQNVAFISKILDVATKSGDNKTILLNIGQIQNNTEINNFNADDGEKKKKLLITDIEDVEEVEEQQKELIESKISFPALTKDIAIRLPNKEDDGNLNADISYMDVEDFKELNMLIEKLPHPRFANLIQCMLVFLWDLKGGSVTEIAEYLGITTNKAKGWLMRFRIGRYE